MHGVIHVCRIDMADRDKERVGMNAWDSMALRVTRGNRGNRGNFYLIRT